MSTTITTTPIVEWTCIRHGNLESWYRPGGYGLIAVVTGSGTRWTWRVYDQNSGVLIDQRSPIRYRLRREQTLAQAKTYALRMLTGHERRWRRSTARRIFSLEDMLRRDPLTTKRRKELKNEIEFLRAQARHKMIIQRGGKNAVCDLCGKKPDYRGFQLHELLQRGLTVHNSPARALSYEPELTALLCADCHSRAHNPVVRNKLFQANYKRYGVERVQKVFQQFRRLYEIPGNHLNIRLPEPENGEHSERQQSLYITLKEVTR